MCMIVDSPNINAILNVVGGVNEGVMTVSFDRHYNTGGSSSQDFVLGADSDCYPYYILLASGDGVFDEPPAGVYHGP
jgi:hypothetical protein